MSNYIALLRKEEDSDFGVDFPDFPGCVTAGTTLDEAKDNAVEALFLHIQGMMEDGDPVPAPSSLDAVMDDPENRDGVVMIVQGPRKKSVRVNVTLPADLLERIDAAASNRSAFLARAAVHELKEIA